MMRFEVNYRVFTAEDLEDGIGSLQTKSKIHLGSTVTNRFRTTVPRRRVIQSVDRSNG